MSRDKQIKEMTALIESSGMLESFSRCVIVAEELHNEGYRKESDVAAEIFAEIEDFIIDQCFLTDAGVAKIYKKLVEVKKQYMEDGK